MTKIHLPHRTFMWLVLAASLPLVHAGETDIASAPLITSAQDSVLPNLMYVLDDSGSMAWTHMPDTARDFASKYGYKSNQCNGVYYNPNITYLPPVDYTGASYPNASFTAAWKDGYTTSGGTVNLSTSFYAYDNTTSFGAGTDTAQAAYYYVYSGTQTTQALKQYYDTNSTFYKECNSSVGSTPGSSVFTKVTVSATSGPSSNVDERTNFANWFSYYRTRILMMKTASGLAFKNIGDRYRVGYMSINQNTSPSFLNISQFTAGSSGQKSAWYSQLYAATAGNSTPLREALSNAGLMYAGKLGTFNSVNVTDPVQYSCQKNFTLLSTDGFWNGSSGFQLDGSTPVGNQDSGEPRPFNDGGSVANQYSATITVSGTSSSKITSVKVNGVEILSGQTTASTSSSTVANRISANINNCTSGITGSCGVAGYSAVKSGSTVTITAPASAGALSSSPVLIQSGSMTITTTPFAGTLTALGGTSETLADVAEYYYKTDLRTAALGNATNPPGVGGTDVATNNVIPSGDDDAIWQHMTTFTLGLGARGRMVYDPAYKSATSGDYYAVKTGATASASVCTWQTAGTTCTWPIPGSDQLENVDDLWHAAVNGRGTYFSASDPASLSGSLTAALQSVNALTSDAAAATTSNPNIIAGDNFLFESTFRSSDWYGDFKRFTLDTTTGNVDLAGDKWSARELLDANTARKIYTFDSSNATTKLRQFTWANLTATEQGYFSLGYISSTATPPLSQFCASGPICLASATQTAASGSPLVDFIRGVRTNEGTTTDISKYYRLRTSVLGDIADSEAVYVKVPRFQYADTGYSTFKTNQASRKPMVYVGANDGMLHAFNGDTSTNSGGQEVWAYIPSMLIPNLYKLADKYYPTKHQYYVDGTPTQADVYFGSAWHTILVGGLNAGGRGYYALDVTDPDNPKALWEFTDTNMGYSFGLPEVTKLKDGTWVVLLTSGYNNDQSGQDGQGHLYVVNAATGVLIRDISTGVGSSGSAVAGVCATAPCPSGLAQIRAWVENPLFDNTTTKVYGGDLFGNLWRFDVNNDVGSTSVAYEAQLLATLRGSSGNVQSITTKPELGKVAGFAVVYVGTGRYLGTADLSDSSSQSIYAIKDALGSTSYGSPRANTTFVQQTLTTGTCPANQTVCTQGEAVRTSSSNVVNWSSNNGWYVDLPGTRERANTDPQLALGTLSVVTNVLDPSACSVGGSSYVNFFDYRTGGAVSTANGIASVSLGNALATRSVQVEVTNASGQREQHSLIRQSDNTLENRLTPTSPNPTATRRTSWRELITE